MQKQPIVPNFRYVQFFVVFIPHMPNDIGTFHDFFFTNSVEIPTLDSDVHRWNLWEMCESQNKFFSPNQNVETLPWEPCWAPDNGNFICTDVLKN